MGIIIGIDIGGSTTKIVGFDNNNLKIPTFVKANNPIASLFGAFGKFIYDNAIQLGDIEKIMYVMTGSSQYIAQSLKAFENKDRKALRLAGEKNKTEIS